MLYFAGVFTHFIDDFSGIYRTIFNKNVCILNVQLVNSYSHLPL